MRQLARGRRAARALTVVAAATSLATAVAVLAVSAAGRSASAAATAAANESAARSDAASLLSRLALPPGTSQSSTEPPGDGGVLANPAGGPAATPNVVDDHAWWTAPGSVHDVLAYISAHRPLGSAPSGQGSGSASGTAYTTEGFAWPAITGVLGNRLLIVEAVPLPGGSTGVRADSQVVWITPRAPSERIPPGARRLWVRVTDGAGKAQRPFLVASARRIGRVVALLNSLPVAQPGVTSCPNDTAARVRLTLYRRASAAPLAVAVIDPAGCQAVQLTLRGHDQPALTSEPFPGSGLAARPSAITQIETALGRGFTLR